MENSEEKNIIEEKKPDEVPKAEVKEPGRFKRLLKNKNARFVPYICLIAVGAFLISAGLRDIIANYLESTKAREEYKLLYDIFSEERTTPTPPPTGNPSNNEQPDDTVEDDTEEDIKLLSLDELAALNSDFIGWFSIENLIEYPIVQGSDNYKYINTTFMGEQNTAGAIFMDSRNTNVWNEEVSIIYGHNSYDGSMFAPLSRYQEPLFLQRNKTIIITTRDGKQLKYEIFAAKDTDAWDSAYSVALTNSARASETFPNAPEGASRFLLLSTCTRSQYQDDRLIIFAALVE